MRYREEFPGVLRVFFCVLRVRLHHTIGEIAIEVSGQVLSRVWPPGFNSSYSLGRLPWTVFLGQSKTRARATINPTTP
jgi:hypothetical protein